MYVEQLDRFSTGDFRQELENELKATQSEHDEKVTKKARLAEQIERLKKDGCQRLQERLSEVRTFEEENISKAISVEYDRQRSIIANGSKQRDCYETSGAQEHSSRNGAK